MGGMVPVRGVGKMRFEDVRGGRREGPSWPAARGGAGPGTLGGCPGA